MWRKEDRKAIKKDRNGPLGKEPRILEFVDKNDESRRKGKKEKKLEQQVKNKLWKIKHQSSSLEFEEEDLNPRHTEYYQTQLPFLVAEWKTFTTTMRQPLPATFRISARCDPLLSQLLNSELQQLTDNIQRRFVENNGRIINGALVKPVNYSPIDHAHNASIWQAQVDNRFLAQCEALNDLHQFIGNETLSGNIVRQEIVSMLPALLLQPQSHHRVLDVCSAPGSKTEQVVSLMASSCGAKNEDKTGFILANDADPKRLDSLRRRFHQSRDPRLALICTDATQLTQKLTNRNQKKMLFDRILCDVPCSGDGTFRKCPHLYRLFRPRYGLELHGVQLRILIEALQMLTVNGRLAYSTCSLNPIEDEAVVAAALRHFLLLKNNNFKIRLVAETHSLLTEMLLPGFKIRSGESQWRGDEEVFCLGDADERQETLKRVKSIVSQLPFHSQSLFPPFHREHFYNNNNNNNNNNTSYSEAYCSEETVEAVVRNQLPYCLRVVPHDQDTGGFFVALFERYEENNLNNNYENVVKTSSSISMDIDEMDTNHKKNIKSAIIHSAAEEGEDAHETMKGLGYNPKDVSSVMRRLQQSHLSLALTHKDNHLTVTSDNIAELRKQLSDMTGVLFPDNTVVSIHLPLNNNKINPSNFGENKVVHSHGVNSLFLASQLRNNNNINNVQNHGRNVSNLQLIIPEHLKGAFCFCALPVQMINNNKKHNNTNNNNNTEEVQDIFLIQRHLANVLGELSVSGQNKAIVYDAAFRIGRFQKISKTDHLEVEVVVVEDEMAMFATQTENEDDDVLPQNNNNQNNNNKTMNNNLTAIKKILKGLFSFGIELFSNNTFNCDMTVSRHIMLQLKNMFEKNTNTVDNNVSNMNNVRVMIESVSSVDRKMNIVKISFLRDELLQVMGTLSSEAVDHMENEMLPFMMLNLQLSLSENTFQILTKDKINCNDNNNVDGTGRKKRMSKAAKRNAKKLEMANDIENKLSDNNNINDDYGHLSGENVKYCWKLVIFRDSYENDNIVSCGLVVGTNCLC